MSSVTVLDKVAVTMHIIGFFFFLSPSLVISIVVGEMVDKSDLVASHSSPASALSEDVLTVFQFYSYILQHEVQNMETHLLHLGREGEHYLIT